MTGRLIAIIGPSGVGKDTLIAALAEARPDLHVVRRAITRPPDDTEPFESLSAEDFARRRVAGGFALDWTAHGLDYGVPMDALDRVLAGQDAVANLSRAILPDATQRFPTVTVLSLWAAPDVLALRLTARGRETPEQIARRLSRPAPVLPSGLTCHRIDTGGTVQASVSAALSALDCGDEGSPSAKSSIR